MISALNPERFYGKAFCGKSKNKSSPSAKYRKIQIYNGMNGSFMNVVAGIRCGVRLEARYLVLIARFFVTNFAFFHQETKKQS